MQQMIERSLQPRDLTWTRVQIPKTGKRSVVSPSCISENFNMFPSLLKGEIQPREGQAGSGEGDV